MATRSLDRDHQADLVVLTLVELRDDYRLRNVAVIGRMNREIHIGTQVLEVKFPVFVNDIGLDIQRRGVFDLND
jgi:hypothetical protein